MERLAFVFSGGGAKGAFGVGVLRELVEWYPRLRWHIVSGTSTGALITPLAALGSEDRGALDALERFYLQARKDGVVESNLDGLGDLVGAVFDLPEGLYNFGPLRRKVGQVLRAPRRKALRSSTVVAVIHAVSLQTGELVLCTQKAHRPLLEGWFRERERSGSLPPYRFVGFEEFAPMMIASSCVPFAIEPEERRLPPEGRKHQLVDGGVIDIAPLRSAIAAGATRIVAVLMSPRRPPPVRDRFENLLTVGTRAVDLLADEVLRNDVEYAGHVTFVQDLAGRLLDAGDGLPAPLREWIDREGRRTYLEKLRRRTAVEVEIVEPPFPLGETFDFDSEWPEGSGTNIMRTRMEIGREMARKALARPSFKALVERFVE